MKGSAYPIAALGGAPSLLGVQAGGTKRFPAAQILGSILQPAGGKAGALGGSLGQLSDGSSTSSTYRHAFRTPVGTGVFNPEVVFSNWSLGAGVGDLTLPPNAISVKATLEFGSNFLAPLPLYFGGKRTVSIDPGANVRSDPVGIVIPANTAYFLRVYVSVAAGGKWPLGRSPLSTGGVEGNNGANGADVTDAYGAFASAAGPSYGPTAVVGHPTVPGLPCVGLLGDSLAAGTNETAFGPNGEQGWLEKRLAANLPWITHTRGGMRLNDFVTGRHARSLAFFGQFCTSVVCELGSNDLYSDSADLPTMQARAKSVWAEFAARGLPVWQSTITPRTTSTDSWATVANQTIASTSVEPVRTAFNDWLRATWPAQGLAGLIEVADTVEVNATGTLTRNGGRWRIDKGQPTIDGTHPAGGLTDAAVMGSALSLGVFA